MDEIRPKMRTIDQAYQCIKDNDPETCLTKYALRQAVVTGKIPSVKCGKKYLVSLQVVENWLQGGFLQPEEPEIVNGIRRIGVKPVLREVMQS